MRRAPGLLACAMLVTACQTARPPAHRGVELAQLTWVEAERVLTVDTIVVIPIGAAAKEHGPHLSLANDWLLAEYFKERVLETEDVVAMPTVGYHFYPAFVEYPGSTSLEMETARDVIVDICKSVARHGPRRFYALNTGVSTVRALEPAAASLAHEGLLLTFTKLDDLAPVERAVCEQEAGSHADEVETSMMLVIAPKTVDMSKAVRDCSPKGTGGLSRDPASGKTYSPSGVWGDATLATREKGEKLVTAFVEIVKRDIAALRSATLPDRRP
jgi:creatinine amidohydrolase